MKACSVADCDRAVWARGWCNWHLGRFYRNGDPNIIKKNPSPRKDEIDRLLKLDTNQCVEWKYSRLKNRGYPIATYPRIKTTRAHRIILLLSTGVKEDEVKSLDACHTCGNGHKGCVNINHLYWGTHMQNELDKVKHGTRNIGEKHSMAILNEEKVREIRSIPLGNITYAEIAKKYGVSRATIVDVRSRRSWNHVS